MITLPLIACVIGLILYLVTLNPKINEVGRIMFAFGLLVALFGYAEKALL